MEFVTVLKRIDLGRTTLVSVALLVGFALVVAAGCGGSSSKPAYCSDRSALESSIKGLTVPTSSSDVSSLKSQLATIQSDAKTLVSSAKSDFPDETSAITTSLDTLTNAVNALPPNPSAVQIGAIAADAATVVSSVKSFTDATSSKC